MTSVLDSVKKGLEKEHSPDSEESNSLKKGSDGENSLEKEALRKSDDDNEMLSAEEFDASEEDTDTNNNTSSDFQTTSGTFSVLDSVKKGMENKSPTPSDSLKIEDKQKSPNPVAETKELPKMDVAALKEDIKKETMSTGGHLSVLDSIKNGMAGEESSQKDDKQKDEVKQKEPVTKSPESDLSSIKAVNPTPSPSIDIKKDGVEQKETKPQTPESVLSAVKSVTPGIVLDKDNKKDEKAESIAKSPENIINGAKSLDPVAPLDKSGSSSVLDNVKAAISSESAENKNDAKKLDGDGIKHSLKRKRSKEDVTSTEESNPDEDEKVSEKPAASKADAKVVPKTVDDVALPETVSYIKCDNGTQLYIVGTAHFSEESNKDVEYIMEKVKPDTLVIELCESRAAIILRSPEEIKESMRNLKLGDMVHRYGTYTGVFKYLLAKMSNSVMEQMDMVPGGEFKAAYTKAKSLGGCKVVLGDRPFEVTIQRAFSSLGLCARMKVLYHLSSSCEKLDKEKIEKFKSSDLLEQELVELAKEFPVLYDIILHERDLYLTRSIYDATMVAGQARGGESPGKVVAVVGIGHVKGIKEEWHNAADIDQQVLLKAVKPPTTVVLTSLLIKGATLAGLASITYFAARRIMRSIR